MSKSRSRSRSGSAGKKFKKKPNTKPKTSLVKGGPLTRPGGKPWTGTTEKKLAPKPLKEWNTSVAQSKKYFDPSIDPKELRKQSKIVAVTKPEIVSKGKEFVVQSDSQGKMEVELQKNGVVLSKVSMYHNIDTLVADT